MAVSEWALTRKKKGLKKEFKKWNNNRESSGSGTRGRSVATPLSSRHQWLHKILTTRNVFRKQFKKLPFKSWFIYPIVRKRIVSYRNCWLTVAGSCGKLRTVFFLNQININNIWIQHGDRHCNYCGLLLERQLTCETEFWTVPNENRYYFSFGIWYLFCLCDRSVSVNRNNARRFQVWGSRIQGIKLIINFLLNWIIRTHDRWRSKHDAKSS